MTTEQPQFYRELLDSLGDGVYFADRDRNIAYWNAGAEELTGYRSDEVIGRCCSDNILMHIDEAGQSLCHSLCPLESTMRDGLRREAEVLLHHKEGHRVPVLIRTAPIRDYDGSIVGAVEIFRNNSDRKKLAQKLEEMERMALVDPLTGLANRRYLESHIKARMEEYRRNHWGFGVLFMDIDHFKQINDSYGHEAGDKVLKMVGRTLDAATRYSDAVGRWGGEEFLAVLANVQPDHIADVSERFRMLVEKSSLVEPGPMRVTLSIGCAHVQDEDTPESLIQRADRKLYEAKSSGRNCVRL